MATAFVPEVFKRSRIWPLLKKPGLNQNQLKNYRLDSNLPFTAKVLEKAVDVQTTYRNAANQLIGSFILLRLHKSKFGMT